MSNDSFPSLAGIKAAVKASATRASSTTTFHVSERHYPVNILKASDFIAPENTQLSLRFEEITPSAFGHTLTAKKRDKLRKKHGLKT